MRLRGRQHAGKPGLGWAATKGEKMKPVMLAKDSGSGRDGCPAVYIEDGQFVVQGPEVGAAELAELTNVLPGETAVRIKIDVVREALARYAASAIMAG